MLAVFQHTGNYEATYIFVRNNESAQLKTEINDGTYGQNFSFFFSFLLFCDSITNTAAKRNFEVMSS
jgi:hypothetical protein